MFNAFVHHGMFNAYVKVRVANPNLLLATKGFGNDKDFTTKALSKAIMQGTRFRNNFIKKPTDEK